MFSARRYALVSALLSVLATSPARAQGAAGSARTDTVTTIVVTATRVRLATAASTATTTVLRGADLRAQGITRVADALRLVPGAAVVGNGPVGSQTSLFVRGGNSDYVRVLVDGVAINEAGGTFNFSSLTTDNIDRIEIVRGPTSVLYGSDAVTGVVQIFTRDGRGPASAHALVGGGSDGALRTELGISGGSDRLGASLSGTHAKTNGILDFNNEFQDDVLSALVRARPDARSDVQLATRWTSATYHYPTDGSGAVVDRNSEQTDHRFVISMDAGRQLTDRVEARVLIASNEYLPRSNDASDSPADTLGFYGFFSQAKATSRSADARVNVHLNRVGMLTLGGETVLEREKNTSLSLSQYGNSPGAFEASRHNSALYAQALGDATPRLSYSLGARLDRNGQFGTFRTARAALAYVVTTPVRVRASFGRAFKEPTFFQNFASGFVTGNPALSPEITGSAELGVDAATFDGLLVLRATGFRQRFHNLIDYSDSPPPNSPNYYNVAAARADGIELEADYHGIPQWILGASYVWTDTRVQAPGFDPGAGATYVSGQPLIRRAPNVALLTVAKTFASGAEIRAVGTRVGARSDRDFTNFPATPISLPAYERFDLSATVPVLTHGRVPVSLLARADNVFDKHYEDVSRFEAPGRQLFAGVTLGRQ